jgi:hypothetical protein
MTIHDDPGPANQLSVRQQGGRNARFCRDRAARWKLPAGAAWGPPTSTRPGAPDARRLSERPIASRT